jgi:predicted permease
VFHLIVPGASAGVLAVDRTLTVAAALIATVVLVTGLLPSYHTSLIDPMEALKGRSVGTGTAWLRRSLLFVQAAVSIMLLIGAGLFVRSLQRAISVELGVAMETLTVSLELQDGTTFGERLAPAIYAAHDRVRAHPDVLSAAITSIPPFGGGWGLEVDVPGPRTIEAGATGPFFISAGPDYFRTAGIPLRDGRALTEQDDRPGAEPVAVVNGAMGRLAWPGERPLGQCLLVGADAAACTRVVGVVADYRTELISDQPTATYYIAPHHPGIGFTAALSLLVRMSGDGRAAVPVLRDIVRTASPDIRFVTVAPLSDGVEPQLRAWRVGASALTAFGLLALLVAAAGLYAVLAFEVAQRRHELAIRTALGASAGDLIRVTAARTLLFTMAGMATGLTAALLLGRVVQSLLFDVRATDPVIYAGAVLTLGAAATLAVLLPLHRARTVEPMLALKEE